MVLYEEYNAGGPSREHDHASAGFCGELFILTRDLFAALRLSSHVSDPESDEAFLAENEAGRFRLWGDGFDVLEGRLDELLDGSVLLSAVVMQMVGIARKLRRYVDRDSELFRNLESMLEKAGYIFPETLDDPRQSWTDELTLLETLEDVAVLNDGLYELTPFLESIPIEYAEIDELENSRAPTIDAGQMTETKALHINILDKFPEAAFNLPFVEQLADLNMRRKKRLWELKEKNESAPDPEPVSFGNGRSRRGARSPSSYAPSTRYTMGTMGSSVASVPYSLLDLQDDGEYARSEASMSSFASMDLEMVGVAQIPPPPVRLGAGVIFECNLCFETLHGIETKYRWKKHVFKDLQPYSCSFLHCPLPRLHLFNSRTEWINHEFEVHRSLPSWTCIKDCGLEFDNQESFREHLKETHLGSATTDNDLNEIVKKCERRKPLPAGQTTICPLCRETISETRKSIRRHLGRHMEEISLAVVPTENYNLEREESSEDEASSSSEEELETIGEEDQDHDEGEDRDTGVEPADLNDINKSFELGQKLKTNEKLVRCVQDIHDSASWLLNRYDEPRWRSEVYKLAQVHEAREGSRSILSEDIRLKTWSMLKNEPSYTEMRDQQDSPEEFDRFLDGILKEDLRDFDELFSSMLEFKQCHLCKEIGLLIQCRDSQQCRHNYCPECPRAAVFPPSKQTVVERQVEAFTPQIPQALPPPFISLVSEASNGPSQLSSTTFTAHPSPFNVPDTDPDRLAVDDGFQLVTNKKAEKQARRPQGSSYAGSVSPSEVDSDAITRTIQVDRKHYPLLIGAGGGTLSDIIVESGGPHLKSAQSRIVQFPRRDSASDRIVVRGAPQVVDGILERIKAKVDGFEARTDRPPPPPPPKNRFPLPVPGSESVVDRNEPENREMFESSGFSRRSTISVGRSHPDLNLGREERRVTEEEMEETLARARLVELEPRGAVAKTPKKKSKRRKKANVARRESEV